MFIRKPSRLEREIAKDDRKRARAMARRVATIAKQKAHTELRRVIYNRDEGLCRATGKPVKFMTAGWRERGEVHHLKFRSAGGGDETSNLILVCAVIHNMIHQHALDADGNGDGIVTFTQRNIETGKIMKVWDSKCPNAT